MGGRKVARIRQLWLSGIVGVLSSLLPGLRDLRAPLAAGYIFLFDLWLLFNDRIPAAKDATGVTASLYRLEGIVSTFGLAVALSFVAYLIGVFFHATQRRLLALEWVGETLVRRLLRFRAPRRRAEDIYPLFLRGQVRIVVNAYSLASSRTVLALSRTVASYGFAELREEKGAFDEDGTLVDPGALLPDELTTIDRQGVITQLMTNRDMQTLYGEFDRQKSESQFRATIFLPLAFLVAILALQEYPLWALLLIGPLYLLAEARLLNQRAEDSLTAAVTSKGAQSFFVVALRENLQSEQSERVGQEREADRIARQRGGEP